MWAISEARSLQNLPSDRSFCQSQTWSTIYQSFESELNLRAAERWFYSNPAPLSAVWPGSDPRQGCTTSAMNGAAYNSHLEVVKWLHENRDEVI